MICIKILTKYFEPNYSRLLQSQGVPKDEVIECMIWAFGTDWKTISPTETYLKWNSRHSDLFVFTETDTVQETMKNIGVAWQGLKHETFMRPEQLAGLSATESKFRRVIVMSFKKEGVDHPSEMMDCLSWGLGFDEELLRCHTYVGWPDAFARNTGILVNKWDTVEKCICLLARRWKTKKKVYSVRVNHVRREQVQSMV